MKCEKCGHMMEGTPESTQIAMDKHEKPMEKPYVSSPEVDHEAQLASLKDLMSSSHHAMSEKLKKKV